MIRHHKTLSIRSKQTTAQLHRGAHSRDCIRVIRRARRISFHHHRVRPQPADSFSWCHSSSRCKMTMGPNFPGHNRASSNPFRSSLTRSKGGNLLHHQKEPSGLCDSWSELSLRKSLGIYPIRSIRRAHILDGMMLLRNFSLRGNCKGMVHHHTSPESGRCARGKIYLCCMSGCRGTIHSKGLARTSAFDHRKACAPQ